jgi:hypothetical protein
MFAYNPTVNDQSGQIIGQGMVGAAQTTAGAQMQMADDIGSALVGLAGAYGEMEGNKAKGRAFKDAFKVIAPSAGIDMKQLEALTGGSLKNDMDWYNARETMAPLLPSLINARLVQGNMGIKQQGQQIQQNAPYVAADIKNRQNIAGGNVPHGGGGGMAPVEPPLPPYSPAPVSQPPAPSANPASSIPGGDESMRRYNEWKSKRGS